MKTCSGTAGLRVIILVLLFGVILGFTGSLLFEEIRPNQTLRPQEPPKIQPPSLPQGALPSFAELAQAVSPAVVNISTTKTLKSDRVPEDLYSPFREFFGEDFWDRFFNSRPRKRKEQSLGSGFIIADDGFIATNAHVVEAADEISIRLSTGETFDDATVVGVDKKTDLALIKVKSGSKLPPPLKIGDSDALRVGDWVIAIGNPFGLDHTVTAGIVSAKGRAIGAGPYEDFIQTDASINPGNSGGPLFNTQGEVVGINSAIFTTTGGNIGIGFAVPINMAKSVFDQLKDKGEVTRGWIGVSIQELTPELAERFSVKATEGVLVAAVVPGGPADDAGIKSGDIIVSVDKKKIERINDLPQIISSAPIGSTVELTVMRAGKEETFTVSVEKMTETSVAIQEEAISDLGIRVEELSPEAARQWGYEGIPGGLMISDVAAGSLAEDAGLQPGDVILEVNRKPVKTLSQYQKAIGEGSTKEGILFLIVRDQNSFYVLVKEG